MRERGFWQIDKRAISAIVRPSVIGRQAMTGWKLRGGVFIALA